MTNARFQTQGANKSPEGEASTNYLRRVIHRPKHTSSFTKHCESDPESIDFKR